MKTFFLLIIFNLSAFAVYCQHIADVSQTRNNELIVRDLKNNRISSKYISSRDMLCGFSTNIIVIRTASNEVIVYDEKWNRISSKYINSTDMVKNVIGENIIIKTKSNEVITYDKKWKRLASRYN
jgi:hypothetical protein